MSIIRKGQIWKMRHGTWQVEVVDLLEGQGDLAGKTVVSFQFLDKKFACTSGEFHRRFSIVPPTVPAFDEEEEIQRRLKQMLDNFTQRRYTYPRQYGKSRRY